MRGRGCQAQPRPTYCNTGWVCNGKGLTILMYHDEIPCVLPDAMVADALAEPWSAVYDSRIPFAGGDHYHLVAPEVCVHA